MEEIFPMVILPQGKLQGRILKTDSGYPYCQFLGIPYAKPPLGRLRFQPPQPPEPWEGIRYATTSGNVPYQWDFVNDVYVGSEDCLFLHVYSPAYPSNTGISRPVIVNIPGGGFSSWSGNKELFGPDFLVEADVVVVSINYRLGPLGFLSLNNDLISGNAGLKDQVAALKWVSDNICAFGGNRHNVTIFGESAGGASVHYHLLSESGKGLFHRAVAKSGCALNTWALQRTPVENALRLCEKLGHPTDDIEHSTNFLLSAPAKDLVKGQVLISKDKQNKQIRVPLVFVPSIEKDIPSRRPFITEDVITLIKQGRCNEVPFMIGYNDMDGSLVVAKDFHNPITVYDIATIPRLLLPGDIPAEKSAEVLEKVKQFYFDGKPMSEDLWLKYCKLQTDIIFAYGINKSARLFLEASEAPIYYYRFSYDEEGVFKKMFDIKIPGASHVDDLGYLFKFEGLYVQGEKGSTLEKVRRQNVRMLVDFMRTGNPTPEVNELISFVWKPLSKTELNILKIDSNPRMKKNPDAERFAFWENIYENI